MAVTRASTSEFGRESAGDAICVLTVNGISGLLLVMLASETNAVAWLRPGRLSPPDALTVFISVFGQSDMRPWTGPAVGESVTRDGLSQVSVVMLWWKSEP